MQTGRANILFLTLGGLLAATLVAAPFIGPADVRASDVASIRSDALTVGGEIFWRLRVPRVAMAALAGATLAVAGCAFQAVFRNPLAEPFTLGVASGASLGAAIGFRLGWTGLLLGFIPTLTILAFAGAMGSALLVFAIARLRAGTSTNTLLLGGVSIGFLCAAVILLMQFLSAEPITNQIVRWLMGSVDKSGITGVLEALPLVLIGAAILWYVHAALDLLMMGELWAAGRGVHVTRVRDAAFLAASMMTASVVAQCGPIAFVGLMIPHMVRALAGPTHRRLLPAAAMAGAIFLPWCDVLAANLLYWLRQSPLQIPVGVVTNLLGGLFFVYLLISRREESIVATE